MNRLPDGRVTEDVNEYLDAWTAISDPLSEAIGLGFKVGAMNPGFRLYRGHETIDVPVDVALRLIELHKKASSDHINELPPTGQSLDWLFIQREGVEMPEWGGPYPGLTVRVTNLVNNYTKITCWADLLAMSHADFLRVKNAGRRALKELVLEFRRAGIKWGRKGTQMNPPEGV